MKRVLTPQLLDALDNSSVVALLGPLQSGKTTPALAIARERPAIHLDLESEQDRAKRAQHRRERLGLRREQNTPARRPAESRQNMVICADGSALAQRGTYKKPGHGDNRCGSDAN